MKNTLRKLGWGAVAGALVIAAMGWLRWRHDSRAAEETESRDTASISTPDAAVASRPVPPDAKPLKAVPCELSTLLDEYRKGRTSPAYRRYVREQLRGLVESLPAETLWSRLLSEREPELLAVVAEAWVLRYSLDGKPEVLERLIEHLREEREPALRATLVRALAHTGEPSTELLGNRVMRGQDVYREWVNDSAPEVRAAVVENFREEAARNFGRFRGVAEKAVSLASVTKHPATAAGLLTSTSIETVGRASAAQVRKLLQSSEHAEVRAAAARALATSPVSELPESMNVLAASYETETDRSVRSALLESISRLGLSQAVPVLQRLRGADAAMQSEMDGWLALLAERPQTWALLDAARRARDAQAVHP